MMTEFDEFEADTEVREQLKSQGIFEAHRLVAEYQCYRNRKDGGELTGATLSERGR